MAVISADLVHSGWTGSRNRLWQRTYKQIFRLVTNNTTDGPVVVGNSLLIPQMGHFYYVSPAEFDAGSFVESIDVAFEEFAIDQGGNSFLATVAYGPYDMGTFGQNPVDWPTVYWWGSQKYEQVLTQDQAGNPIRNSAKDPFEEPITRDATRPLLFFERNVLCASYDNTLADSYRDTLNLYTWNTYLPKTVKCESIEVDKPQKDSVLNVWYFVEKSVFAINPNGWQAQPLDQGFSILDTSTPPKAKRLLDTSGQPLGEPVLLDGAGHQLATTATPVFLAFDVYPTMDFSALNLSIASCLGR